MVLLKIQIFLLLKLPHGIYRLVRASLLERVAWEALADSLHRPVLHIALLQNREGYMQGRERWPSVSPFIFLVFYKLS